MSDKQKIHFIIVSDQIFQNLIPILEDGPDVVVLALSEKMKVKGNYKKLTNYLDSQKIKNKKIRYEILFDLQDQNIVEIYNWAIGQLEKNIIFQNCYIVFNITGGSKLMSLGISLAAQLYRGEGEIIYVHTEHKTKEIINPQNLSSELKPLKSVLRIKSVLSVLGYTIAVDNTHQKNQVLDQISSRKDLTYKIANFCIDSPNLIEDVNFQLSNGTESKLGVINLNNNLKQYLPLFETMEKLGLVSKLDNDKYKVTDPDLKKYITGGWLEEFIFLKLNNLDPQIDLGLGVRAVSEDGEYKNEFDVLAIRDNNFLVCECKTTRPKGKGKGKGNSPDIYKLNSIALEYGGALARKWYVSVFERSKLFYKLAKENNLLVIEPKSFDNIETLFNQAIPRRQYS